MGPETYLIAILVAGFGYVLYRDHSGGVRHSHEREQRGLIACPNLGHLPGDLQRTVLFAVGDGGHERDVWRGEMIVGDQVLPFTQFELRFQRDVRGEWGYLTTEPPFRLHSPVTVLACELPVELPRVLLKRRGPTEQLLDSGAERMRSVADIARDLSAIDRALAVEPPDDLPVQTVPLGELDTEYLMWADDAALITPEVRETLLAPPARSHEIVFELCGSLLLAYRARNGVLTESDSVALAELTRVLAAAALSPRGE